MELALTDLFAAKWTDRIHEEWISNLLDKRQDLTRAQLERTRQLMNSHVRDCLVKGYEALEAAIVLRDADDRHVVAAAIKCHAQGIVTYNLKDFPAAELSKYGIEATHPDDFIASQIGLSLNRLRRGEAMSRTLDQSTQDGRRIPTDTGTLRACANGAGVASLRGANLGATAATLAPSPGRGMRSEPESVSFRNANPA